MTNVLHIESSPRKKRSTSIDIAKHFLENYQAHTNHDIKTVDLWNITLPPFNDDVIDAKYAIMNQQAHSEAQRKAWYNIEEFIREFKSADKYVFSLPMWNFSIPYVLKHYFDIIVQPSYTFSFSPTEGYQGLINNKPALVIYSRSGSYGPGSGAEALDLQKKYMETILNFIGIKDITSIIVEPTGAGAEKKNQAIESAKQKAEELAKSF